MFVQTELYYLYKENFTYVYLTETDSKKFFLCPILCPHF